MKTQICPYCNKEFKTESYRRRVYCSLECYRKEMRERTAKNYFEFKNCLNCGKKFFKNKFISKGVWETMKFCSTKCSGEYVKKTSKPKFNKDREWLYRKYIEEELQSTDISKLVNVSTACIKYWLHKFNIPVRTSKEARKLDSYKKKIMGEKNPFWGKGAKGGGGGSRITGGYRYLYMLERSKYSHNNYILEHHYIAENALGRSLKKDEVVHHINGDSLDNRPKNLLICDKRYHLWLHQHMAELYMKEHF